MTDRARALVAYLDAAAGRPWAWGEHDCCQFVRGWLVELGVDPALGFPAYGSAGRAMAHVRRSGGLAGLFWRLGAKAGLKLASEPYSPGDVGVVSVTTPEGPAEAGAIFAGRRWVALAPVGVIGVTAQPQLAWRV